MALHFADILNAEANASCKVPASDDTLAFKFRPNILTPNLLAEFEQAKEGQASTDGFKQQFVKFISWWDIDVPGQNADGSPATDAAGEPLLVNLPITLESVGNMGFFLLSAVMTAAVEAAKPGEAKSATS